jgi:hypothetical protein
MAGWSAVGMAWNGLGGRGGGFEGGRAKQIVYLTTPIYTESVDVWQRFDTHNRR